MKRLLFLSWFFPPQATIGAVRTGNMAKELLAQGWEITVLTLNPEHLIKKSPVAPLRHEHLKYNFIETPNDPSQQNFLEINAFLQKHGGFTALMRKALYSFGLHESGIFLAILKAAATYQKGDFDLILASGSPFCQFWAAQILSQKIACPYVLDYRDPWSQNILLPPAVRLFRPLEKALRRKSALTLCVSPGEKALLSALGGRTEVLSNGYEKIPEFKDLSSHKSADIVYTGRLYLPDRDVLPLLMALKKVKEAQKAAPTFAYYGPDSRYVAEKAAKLAISDLVFCSPPVPRIEAIKAQKAAAMVLVVTGISPAGSPYTDAIVTGKIFEPIALKKPILLIAPKSNDAVKILKEIGGGVHFDGSQIDEMAAFLTAGNFSAHYNKKRLNYSWPHLGRRLNSLLTGALS